MVNRRRQKERQRLLPGSVESGLRRLVLGGYGLGIIAIACAAWASLATWSVYDPSFNNATQAAPRNLLGHWGAVLADLAIQSLGLASIVLFLPLAAWGWHLVLHTVPERGRARLFIWPIAVLLLAGGAYWLMKSLDEHRKLLDCVASGRRNCVEQIEPAAGPPTGG